MNSATSTDPGLRPWQLFVLAGMLAATGVVLVSTGRPLSSIVVLSLTVVAASLVAVAAYQVFGPLLDAQSPVDDGPVGSTARLALEREKALVLRTIKELEFDHAMRKTATADFEAMRDRLRRRAVGLMQQLDANEYRAAIERDLAGRADSSRPAPTPERPGRDAAAQRCAACATPNDGDARFCKRCGAPLTTSA